MHTSCFRSAFKYGWVLLAFLQWQSPLVSAQQSLYAAALKAGTTEARPEPAPVSFVSVPAETPKVHRFWDNQNRVLFATVAGFSAADFCVTRANLAHGGRELNPVTRVLSGSTPGLAVNFSLETASVIGASYLFHRTNHHRLERLVSMANIGSSAAAVAFDLAHR